MSSKQPPKQLTEEQILKAKQKEERRLAFEAKRAAELKDAKKSTEQSDKSESKSKAELKKERREKQEAQRAAKQQQQQPQIIKKTVDTTDFIVTNESNTVKDQSLPHHHNLKEVIHHQQQQVRKNDVPDTDQQTTKISGNKSSTQLSRSSKSSPISSNKKDQIFAHIPKRRVDLNELTKGIGYNNEQIHSSIIRIGLKMNQNLITDPTSRCIALLVALKSVIRDYQQSSTKQISRDLEQKLDKYVHFLDECRPLSVSMRNVIRIVRSYITKLNPDLEIDQVKDHLINLIDKFIYEEIECGLDGIREHGNLKINQNDVILTFGNSFLIKHIFKEAKQLGKQFRVIVVDSYPRLDGRKMVEFLNQLNIDTTYVLISALSYVMKEVNKVLIEAHIMLANGCMISDMGSSQIALVAKSHNVPVLICCETYKFSERVHTDSFVFNEADSTKGFLASFNANNDLLKLFNNADDQQQLNNNKNQNLNILNLYYDVTPREFISLVITEMGFLPTTATPAIIRRNICKFQLDG